MNNSAVGGTWEELQAELFTPEEIAASKLRVALIGELIKAQQDKGLSQKKLEELSGVNPPPDNPKFCVKVIYGANRAKFIMGGRR